MKSREIHSSCMNMANWARKEETGFPVSRGPAHISLDYNFGSLTMCQGNLGHQSTLTEVPCDISNFQVRQWYRSHGGHCINHQPNAVHSWTLNCATFLMTISLSLWSWVLGNCSDKKQVPDKNQWRTWNEGGHGQIWFQLAGTRYDNLKIMIIYDNLVTISLFPFNLHILFF